LPGMMTLIAAFVQAGQNRIAFGNLTATDVGHIAHLVHPRHGLQLKA
jgi:hypothetical protein